MIMRLWEKLIDRLVGTQEEINELIAENSPFGREEGEQ